MKKPNKTEIESLRTMLRKVQAELDKEYAAFIKNKPNWDQLSGEDQERIILNAGSSTYRLKMLRESKWHIQQLCRGLRHTDLITLKQWDQVTL